MKDVTEILSKRLARLDSSFSIHWISDFLMLMEYVKGNRATQHIINSIQEKKKHAHESLFEHMQSLFKDGSNCLKQIKCHAASDSSQALIKSLLEMSIDPKCIRDPFIEMESVFLNYCKTFRTLFKDIHISLPNVPIAKYCLISVVSGGMEDLNIKLSFSPYLQLCQDEIDKLAGLRDSSIWGKWDELLKWEEWTKNGISPTNEIYERNLSDLFIEEKIPELVQSCSLYFLECLSNIPLITPSSQKCLKALEIFVDDVDRYWIIIHFEGESDDRRAYFIKKLPADTNSYRLAKILIDAEPYTYIDFPALSHTLGELEIKKELRKVFFMDGGKFSGSLVHLSSIEDPINSSLIIDTLNSLERQKKRLPSFNWANYFRSQR